MKKRLIQIASPTTGKEEWQAIKRPLLSGWLTQGPKVKEFESRFADRHGVKHSIAVTSGTAGLHLALAAMGVSHGDEVLVPAFTWVATANAVLYCGAKPIFVDILRSSFNMDPSQISDKITEKTTAIIPVHLFGMCADIDAIRAIIPSHIKVVEDAACAAGAAYKGKNAGSLGDVASFSFHPRKSITTGEGGMVTTNDDEIADLIYKMRNHGASSTKIFEIGENKSNLMPDFNVLGFNYRMTDLQGAVGIVQLDKLDSLISDRVKWAQWYSENLSDIDWISLPNEPDNGIHAWQSFVVYIEPDKAPMSRNNIMDFLLNSGISTRPGTHAIHMLGIYKSKFGFKPNDYPVSRNCYEHSMALPLHNKMTIEDYKYVVYVLREIDKKYNR